MDPYYNQPKLNNNNNNYNQPRGGYQGNGYGQPISPYNQYLAYNGGYGQSQNTGG